MESTKTLDDVYRLTSLSQGLDSSSVSESRSVYDEDIYVDGSSLQASDSNQGTADAPLQSISAGIKKAVQFKKKNRSAKVIVLNGTYRESVRFDTYTNYHKNQPNNQTPIRIEGESFGGVIVSGADKIDPSILEVFGKELRLPWDVDWGVQENPTRGTKPVEDIVRRREMIFQENKLLKQVLTRDELVEGSFLVEEDINRISFIPYSDLENEFEVASRDILWNQNHEHQVEISNFIFEKAATPWRDEKAAVIVANSKVVSLSNVDIRWNNGRGILAVNSENVELRKVRMNYNGWDGWGTWRVKKFSAIDTETSYNNWRGHLGKFYIWSVGNKLLATHGLRIENHRAEHNYSRGLWLDYDNTDVVIESLYLNNNLKDGIFIEANPGPIEIRSSEIKNNGDFGILAANSEEVSIVDTEISGNHLGAMNLTGVDDGREIQDWDSRKVISLGLINWKWEKNIFSDGIEAEYVISTTLGKSAWGGFVQTLRSDENKWISEDPSSLIESPFVQVSKWKINAGISLDDWKKDSGKDQNSTYENRGK